MMALPQVIQSILDKFQSAFSSFWTQIPKIFKFGFWSFAFIVGLILSGLIGTGCVILGMFLTPFAIFFSPILVPIGILVGAMTLVTLAVLGILVWRKRPIVKEKIEQMRKAAAGIAEGIYKIGDGIARILKAIGNVLQSVADFADRIYQRVIQLLPKSSEKSDSSPKKLPKVPARPPGPLQDSSQKPSAAPENLEKPGQGQAEISSSCTPEKSGPVEDEGQKDDSFHSPECHPALPPEENNFGATSSNGPECEEQGSVAASRSTGFASQTCGGTRSAEGEFVFVDSSRTKANGAGAGTQNGSNGHGHGHQDQPSSWSDFKVDDETEDHKPHPDTPVPPNQNNKQNKNRRKKQQQQQKFSK